MLFGFDACRSAKEPSAGQHQYQISDEKVTSQAQASTLLQQVVSGYGRWERVRVPMTVRISSPKSISVSGTAVLERDKSVTLSLKFFGMEIGVLQLTGDSVVVLDKHSKAYIAERIDTFLGGFPATVANVQDLLLGRLFQLGDADVSVMKKTAWDYDVFPDGNGWSCTPLPPADGIAYGFAFNPPSALTALVVSSGGHNPVNCIYGAPFATPFGPMAESVGVEVRSAKTDIAVALEWNLSKARWNDDVELRDITIPSGYRRITAAEIMKKLKTL